MGKQKSSRELILRVTRGGVIAAIYATLTLVFAPFSFGAVQFRISEALCVLPVFFPEAVLGLFVGCIVANIFSSNIVIADMIFGSLATLVAAMITRKLKSKWLVPLPSVVVNAVVVGLVITFSMLSGANSGGGVFAKTYLINMLEVGFGEFVVCYAGGIPLMMVLSRLKEKNVISMSL